MKNILYEKPRLISKRVTLKTAIADPCWSPPSGDAWSGWYNDPGFGGVHIIMSSNGGSCGNSLTIDKYIDNDGQFIDRATYAAQHTEYGADIEGAIYHEVVGLVQNGHNEGQNFNGSNPLLPPGPPDNPPDVPWSV